MRAVFPLIFNAIFLISLIESADIYKNALIDKQLGDRKPDCVDHGSFRRSVFDPARNFWGNAIFEERGRVYLWSYAEEHFFEASPGLALNFTCRR